MEYDGNGGEEARDCFEAVPSSVVAKSSEAEFAGHMQYEKNCRHRMHGLECCGTTHYRAEGGLE